MEGVCREQCEPMKPSSDRSVRVCAEGGSVVGGQRGSTAERERDRGDGGGLGEGTAVARADRDVSAASVISRRLATARGHHGASREQRRDRADHPDNANRGPGGADKSRQEEVIFEKSQKSPWKLA